MLCLLLLVLRSVLMFGVCSCGSICVFGGYGIYYCVVKVMMIYVLVIIVFMMLSGVC